ncbi:MAG TPA: phosphatase PAP2 family protein [Candidatus Nitrosotalea sp.]|nr:phosphatase PAP2 family protein [Candidatus Nitrosotalea sp.]
MKYVVLSAVLLAGFVVLSFLISSDNSVTKWDTSAFQSINNPHGKILDKIMVDLTKYGREVVWISVILLLAILGKTDGRKTAVLLTIAFLVLIPLGTVLKSEIDRTRPSSENLLLPDTGFSFPSGHATIVSAGAAILFLRFNKGRQLIFSVILGIEAVLVSYSRIYVGNHYPLDVVGGILLGTGIACAVIASSKYLGPVFSYIDNMKK